MAARFAACHIRLSEHHGAISTTFDVRDMADKNLSFSFRRSTGASRWLNGELFFSSSPLDRPLALLSSVMGAGDDWQAPAEPP